MSSTSSSSSTIEAAPGADAAWRSLLPAVVEAGRVAAKLQRSPLSSDQKSAALSDIVTNADRAANDLLARRLGELLPGVTIVSEEGPHTRPDAEVLVIDPIDGTTNFAAGLPLWCISVGLVDRQGRAMAGVVGEPLAGRYFVAERGSGAWLVDEHGGGARRLRVSAEPLVESLFAVSLSDYALPLVVSSNRRHRGVRAVGCMALTLAWVAAGQVAGLVGRGHPWDIAAGLLLIEEAGGRSTRLDGGPREVFQRIPSLFSNAVCHDEVLDILRAGTNFELA